MCWSLIFIELYQAKTFKGNAIFGIGTGIRYDTESWYRIKESTVLFKICYTDAV